MNEHHLLNDILSSVYKYMKQSTGQSNLYLDLYIDKDINVAADLDVDRYKV